MDNYLVEKIAKFYRVCLFGSSESDVYKAAANRAYRDLCRTITFRDKDNKKHIYYRSEIVGLIITKIQDKLFENHKPSQETYDDFHADLCNQITEYTNEVAENLTYGQAQKWVNMTMKYLCVLSNGNFTGNYEWLGKFYPYLHVPIDSIILTKAQDNKYLSCKSYSCWSKLDYKDYEEIQKNLRKSLTAMSPMDWEFEVWG